MMRDLLAHNWHAIIVHSQWLLQDGKSPNYASRVRHWLDDNFVIGLDERKPWNGLPNLQI